MTVESPQAGPEPGLSRSVDPNMQVPLSALVQPRRSP